MKKWIYVPKKIFVLDIPENITILSDGWQKEAAIDKLVSDSVMQHVNVTDYKEGEHGE